jgi:heme/copper-type cytochrome/quinol oxidase subunit 3
MVGVVAAAPTRNRTLLVGTAFAVAASVMFFACLFGVYLKERAGVRAAGEAWIPQGVRIELTPPTMIVWTLLISCFFVQWAVYSIARDDRGHAYFAIAMSIVFGIMVVVQTTFQYTQMGLAIDDGSAAAPLIYTISGAHLTMLVGAMLFMLFMGFRALAGQFSSRQTDGLVAVAMYWYATTFVYFVMWIAIFIAK